MATYDAELLDAARQLLDRRTGQRGKLPSARIRRSISTSYYALFHFLLEEVGMKVVGTGNALRKRRRVLARTISHKGMKITLDKMRGPRAESLEDFLRPVGSATGPVTLPLFVQDLAKAFADAQAKRHDADYDLNKVLSERDARLLIVRVQRVIAAWRAATGADDRNFKDAVCILFVLKGQLRPEP
jgi:uncharacterized protein (UPF0332 family)